MPATSANCRRVLRPDPSSASRTALCVLAFLATGAAILWLTAGRSRDAERYAATATIWHREAPSSDAGLDAPEGPVFPRPATVRQRVLSEDYLRQALRQVEGQEERHSSPSQNRLVPASGGTVERVRRNLQVTAYGTSPERLGVAISYFDRDPDRAVKLVNALATNFAEQYRAELQKKDSADAPEAGEAAERARQEFFEAQGRYDDFVEQHFLKQQALADRVAGWKSDSLSVQGDPAEQAAGSRGQRGVVEAPPHPPGDPQEAKLQRQLSDLKDHRAQLLTKRTPRHPEVQKVDLQIAGLRERLASISAHVAERQPEVLPAEQEPASGAPVAENRSGGAQGLPHGAAEELAGELADAAEAFRRHQDALDRAQEEYDRLAEARRRAWQARISTPSIELELAEVGVPCQPADGPSGSVLVALASALAVTFGVGLIWSGFDTDVPLATLAEAEATLGVPVVGTVPRAGPASAPSNTCSQRGGRLAKITFGVLLIGVCFGVLAAVL